MRAAVVRPAFKVIRFEAKRAAWIYPVCWAAGAFGAALLQILDPARF